MCLRRTTGQTRTCSVYILISEAISKMTLNENPLVSFIKRLLDPFIITGALYLITIAYDEPFTGYYLMLVINCFFISSFVFEQIDMSRTWRSGRLFAYTRDVIGGWLMIVGIIVFITYVTGL